MSQKVFAYLQYILPQYFISELSGKIADIRIPFIKNWQIKKFIKDNDIDMSKVLVEDINQYKSLNKFFIRKLKPETFGNSSSNEVASPAEATITEFGKIDQDILLQAKNKRFTLDDLLANEKDLINCFNNGSYMIFFLSPHDYHRFHMPLSGTLIQSVYVPGRLYGVDPDCQEIVSNLYARNERYITLFDTEIGRMAVILIGAMLVGRIQTAWMKSPIRASKIIKKNYNKDIILNKNDELGCFKAGSSIILLFEPGKVTWKNNITTNSQIEVCQAIGDIVPN